MPRTSPPLPTSLFLLALALARPVAADGVPVAPAAEAPQAVPRLNGDGRGGAIVAYKTATQRLGAVHLDTQGLPDGKLVIAPQTAPFTIDGDQPVRAAASSDSLVMFVADRAVTGGPAATRWRSGGTTSGAFPVALPTPMRWPEIVPGLGGRTLLIAKDSDGVSFWTLRAAILGADGTLEFSIQLPSVLQFFLNDRLAACSDGAGGLLAAMSYYDLAAATGKDIAMFHLAADGSRPWGDILLPLVRAANDQTDVQVAPDGAGGMFLAWTDPRAVSRSTDIFTLRVSATGERDERWSFYGDPVSDALGAQSQPRLLADGTGGVWIVWLDQARELAGDLRYSHLLGDGTLAPGFTPAGRVLCDANGAQAEAVLAGDGAGGMFVLWRDSRADAGDLYVQHVATDGSPAAGWAANGRVLCAATGLQDQPALVAVSAGRALAAWRDARSSPARVYSAAIVDASTVGVGPAAADALRLSCVRAARGLARVRLTLPQPGAAALDLLDVSGRSLAHVVLAGPLRDHELTLDTPTVPGLYFARLRQGPRTAVARLTVLR